MIPQPKNCLKCGNQHNGQDCAVNPVIFEWKYGGENVRLFGSWTQFQVGHPMVKSRDPPYFHTIQMNLERGSFEFKFNVDGVWKFDHTERLVADSYGSQNNVIDVLPSRLFNTSSGDEQMDGEKDVLFRMQGKENVRVKIKTDLDCQEVFIAGSWDNWAGCMLLKRRYLSFAQQYQNYGYFYLEPGSYQYKFIIGGQWVYDQTLPSIENQYNSKNNIIHVKKLCKSQAFVNYDRVYFTQYQIVNCRFERINGLSLTNIGDEFYIFGGCGSNFTNNFYVINSTTHALQVIDDTKGPIPDPRAYHNAIKYGNKIIIYGGLNQNKVFDDYYVYNTTSKIWSQSKPKGQVPPAREKASLTFMQSNHTLVYFGGYYCSFDMEVEKVFNDVHCLNLTNMIWTELNIEPSKQIPPRYGHTANMIKEKMYVFAGQDTTQGHEPKVYNDMWLLDFSQKECQFKNLTNEIKGQPPSPRYGHSAVLLQRHIFIFGGRGQGVKEFLGDLFHFDPDRLIWSQPEVSGTVPIPRCYHACESYHNNELWIVGGNAGFHGFQYQLSNSRNKHHPHLYVMSFVERDDDDTWFQSPEDVSERTYQDRASDYVEDDDFKFQLEKIQKALTK